MSEATPATQTVSLGLEEATFRRLGARAVEQLEQLRDDSRAVESVADAGALCTVCDVELGPRHVMLEGRQLVHAGCVPPPAVRPGAAHVVDAIAVDDVPAPWGDVEPGVCSFCGEATAIVHNVSPASFRVAICCCCAELAESRMNANHAIEARTERIAEIARERFKRGR